MRLPVVMIAIVLLAAPAFAESDSVTGGVDEVGRAVKDDVKDGYDKTRDVAVEGYDRAKGATEHGVGKALQASGSGIDKAGSAVEGAGEKVDDSAK
jgi:phage-related protein